MRGFKSILVAAGLTICIGHLSPVQAQQNDGKAIIGIELNTLDSTDKACRFSFVMRNDTSHDVQKLAAEFALFDKDGRLAKLTVFNFGKLQPGRTQVKQFEIGGADCDSYSRMLLNAVKTCDGFAEDLASCEAALRPSNKTTLEFGN